MESRAVGRVVKAYRDLAFGRPSGFVWLAYRGGYSFFSRQTELAPVTVCDDSEYTIYVMAGDAMPPSLERQRIVSEQQNTLDALKAALQMEIDGKEFYTRAAQESRDELGKKLLTALASEEDHHRQVFVRIYEAIRDKKGWPDVDFKPDGGRSLQTIFTGAGNQSEVKLRASENELAAVTKARAMEGRTYDFYHSRKQQASDPAEREFYESLAGQEQQHNLVLADYHEYLINQVGWFVSKEHPSLD